MIPLTEDGVKYQTFYILERIKNLEQKAAKIKDDADKDKRLEKQLCIWCYNSVTIAGQAFTNYTCHICGKNDIHPNTAVPKLCKDCAKKHSLCRNCSSDINLDLKRKHFE